MPWHILLLRMFKDMEKMKSIENISDEQFAAFLDGNVSVREMQDTLKLLSESEELQECLSVSERVDEVLDMEVEHETLPIRSLAASDGGTCLCDIQCEDYILRKRGLSCDLGILADDARKNKWLKDKGVPLFHIGRLLGKADMTVTRRYHCTFEDLRQALSEGKDVIAVVDGGELTGDAIQEKFEDLLVGKIPDHAVVVIQYDSNEEQVCLYDPQVEKDVCRLPVAKFMDAWADSNYYMVVADRRGRNSYIPHPIDLSDVELSDDLNELKEAIAENAHEVWAENRMREGWTYGPVRDDDKKQTPDMVAYSDLPESEKHYDREMAIKTIKLVKKLGYDLVKNNESELYYTLLRRIKNIEHLYHCGNCGGVIFKHQVFCEHCGKKLDFMDYKD